MVVTGKGAGATYGLEVESSGKMSDHGCDCKRSRDDVQSGGGEGGARGQMTQITVVTAKGPGMTYILEVESSGKRSDHSCDCQGMRQRTAWMWSRRASSQITVRTTISVIIYHLERLRLDQQRDNRLQVQLWILGPPQEYLHGKLGW